MDLRIGVLGPLTVTVNGTSVVPTAAKPRNVLALLAVRAGQVVPVPVILEELWDGHPPTSALTTLQTYILQLRRLLETALAGVADPDGGAKSLLRTAFGGYQLAAPPEACDVAEFDRLGQMGLRALELGDPATAQRLLREADRVWRGAALLDVEFGPRLQAEARYLEDRRITLVERRTEAGLAIGRHSELLGELAALTTEYRLNERFCEQYMRVLHRCGRSVDALGAFRRIRRDLTTELGTEPGPRLQHLERAILGSAPERELDFGRAQLVP
ncbi:AfsR/SARP family transcriptional regulator [Kitasatospora sp. NBC_01287]|uniref:AfsR/SARP family transcriptional regulator n=1 Tax=Kitasatospora sp. NBC_01287 TaxID=2903573 RepID=UPI0022556168|nr:AfsR/SARP family transcriptional regulator [Kitasatospora sp. NBC_01287]MCX4748887.1 AfsR/SARP family transcriptional regulator [Kitasatospora sp. NBC_01287]